MLEARVARIEAVAVVLVLKYNPVHLGLIGGSASLTVPERCASLFTRRQAPMQPATGNP
jgi:hypothetical protein